MSVPRQYDGKRPRRIYNATAALLRRPLDFLPLGVTHLHLAASVGWLLVICGAQLNRRAPGHERSYYGECYTHNKA
jgi:hypothetical protein